MSVMAGNKPAKRAAIIGAGPIGLDAALNLRQRGWEVAVYERGRLAEYVQRWGHVRLFSPFAMNSTTAGRAAIRAALPDHAFPGDGDVLTGRQYVTSYLEPLTRVPLLKDVLKLETQVVSVGRRGMLKGDA